jgi:hypothetical protein
MIDVGGIFADALRPKWAPGLNNVTKPEFASMEKWLLNGTYGWLPPTNGSARLDLRGEILSSTGALASEISRFSCAAYESLVEAVPAGGTRGLGWSLVRHYYAAFYCAHALLRIGGSSLTYIPSTTVSRLNKVGGQYLGVSPQITSGVYFIKPDPTAKHVVILEKASDGTGGSHEDMWERFLALLVDLENRIVLSQGNNTIAQDAVKISEELRSLLCRQGKKTGGWPSTVRNAVNYRHDYGVWFPYTLPQLSTNKLIQKMNQWQPNNPNGFEIGSAREDLGRFIEIGNVIAHLLTSALQDISRRSPLPAKSFVDRQAFKLLREKNVAI